jgi:hypothetical protein
MGAELADALRATGRAAEANTVFATTKQVASVTSLDGLIRGVEEQLTVPPVTGDSAGVTLRVDANSQPRIQSTEPHAKKPRP